MLCPANSMVVSSANKMDTNLFDTIDKSFTCKINNKDPRTDPWGTPHDTVSISELLPSKCTYCFLLLK